MYRNDTLLSGAATACVPPEAPRPTMCDVANMAEDLATATNNLFNTVAELHNRLGAIWPPAGNAKASVTAEPSNPIDAAAEHIRSARIALNECREALSRIHERV